MSINLKYNQKGRILSLKGISRISILIAIASLLGALPLKAFADDYFQIVDNIKTIHGKNYDIVENYNTGEGIQELLSYERILDFTDYQGLNHWVNYKYYDTPTFITFESAKASLTFSKQSCGLKLYDSGKVGSGETPIVNYYGTVVKEAPNGSVDWIDSEVNKKPCKVSLSVLSNGLIIKSVKSDANNSTNSGGTFTVTYNVDWRKGVEDTYSYVRYDNANLKFGFTTVINTESDFKIGDKNIDQDSVGNQLTITKDDLEGKNVIIEGKEDIVFDTKDLEHDKLLLQRVKDGQTVFDFTNVDQPLKKGQTIMVDPSFSLLSGSDYSAVTADAPDTSCGTPTSISTIYDGITIPESGVFLPCVRTAYEFDITTLAGKDIEDVFVKADIVSATGGQ